VSALVLGIPVAGSAQDAGKTGVTLAYPGAVGILWHVSDAVALRPTVTFSRVSLAGLSDTHSTSLGADLSVLLYMKKYDAVRTYVSPRLSYVRSSNSGAAGTIPLDLTSHSTGFAGSFGAQYTPTPHFGVYAEAGVGYSRRTAPSSISSITSRSTSWGTTAGVGVVVYP